MTRLLREYNLLAAAITATVAFFLLMGWVQLSQEQVAGLLAAVAAWLLVLRFLVTPVGDPVLADGTTGHLPDGSPATFTKDG